MGDVNRGKVYLVGGGPGNPLLITLRGKQVLERADVVFYDNLASTALLDYAPVKAERVYVGKKKAAHAFSQQDISGMLVERARGGQTVVRLKGGDPLIFGRGGEEMEALAEAGIPFEIVPGVTTPLGAAAYCGVPLTHRDHTSVVSFVTGHDPAAIDWARVGLAETLVLFMGLSTFREIARELMARGRAAATPAMVVRWATRPDQEVLVGTLGDLAGKIDAAQLKPPATIILGEVVGLRERFSWYEKLPLFGKRIVITRAAEQAGELGVRLEELGAEVVEFPVIGIRPPLDFAPLDAALGRLASYDWLIFTSVNGVRCFLERLDRSPHDLRGLRAKIATIGPATRQAVEALHLKVDVLPRQYVAESLVEAFAGEDLAGRRVLLPRAAVARDVVPVELAARGAIVDVVEVYRTVVPEDARDRAAEVFREKPDWVTFTSSSTVKNFLAVAGREALEDVRIASIGPVTSETVRMYGLEVAVEAREHTMEGLIAAICEAG